MYADAGPRTLIINLIMLLTQHRPPNIRPSDTQTLVRVNIRLMLDTTLLHKLWFSSLFMTQETQIQMFWFWSVSVITPNVGIWYPSLWIWSDHPHISDMSSGASSILWYYHGPGWEKERVQSVTYWSGCHQPRPRFVGQLGGEGERWVAALDPAFAFKTNVYYLLQGNLIYAAPGRGEIGFCEPSINIIQRSSRQSGERGLIFRCKRKKVE